MSTHELYTIPVEHATWDVEMQGASRFTWEYDDGRDRLLSLYQKGKDKQWDQVHRIDWDVEVDPDGRPGPARRGDRHLRHPRSGTASRTTARPSTSSSST